MADLSDYTSLRVGGPAKKFMEVSSEQEIIAAIEGAGDSPILIMGAGTNMLVSDDGFAGTVIRISNNKIEAEVDACSGATLTIGAGENWDEFVKTTISRGFAGLDLRRGGVAGSGGVRHTVILDRESEKERCTCTWFSSNQGERGACKHILAVKKLVQWKN